MLIRWDKVRLEPGQSWEDGFCDGLLKSRIFLPILSRGAINHPEKSWQNFSQLTADSNCDNVLLEHLLSLELQTRGLIERIYPVMIGDLSPSSVDGEPGVYANYFGTGCHPRLPDPSVEVKSVAAVARGHLDRLCLGSPLLDGMTVSKVLGSLTKNQGKLVEGRADRAFDAVLADTVKMLLDCKKADAVRAGQQEVPMLTPDSDGALPVDHSYVLDLSGVDCGQLDDVIPPESAVIVLDDGAV
jgi:hypothetical protein